MTWVFLAALIFGGGLLVPMLLGGLGGDLEVDGDLELDAGDLGADVGADLDADGDVGLDGDASAVGRLLSGVLSLRSLVFFSAFFGGSGLLLDALGYAPAPTIASAVVVGVGAALLNSVLMDVLRRTEGTSQISDATLVGRAATVVLPMAVGRRGRIRVELDGQPHYLVAGPVEGDATTTFDVGHPVVVVDIIDGTALVSSLAGLEPGTEA